MSLADIKKKIENDARDEAGRILEKARENVEAIKKNAADEIKKMENGYSDRFKKEQPEILRRREIVAGLDVKKIELGVRQQAITDAFQSALKTLA
ncbi:MAG TPA: V-type ATPase subunit subunit G family protein, partial [Aminobacteriaceae bacterium]|nr:V-type ATPase subunit subunit G family protein [Aminobacteriaceae bacterium]